jgi:hypothetical protein
MVKPSGPPVGVNDLVEAGLVHRNLAPAEPVDLARILVDTGGGDAEFQEAEAEDEPRSVPIIATRMPLPPSHSNL